MTPTILTQSEIDALLATIPTDDAAGQSTADSAGCQRDARAHDYGKPGSLSADQLRALEMIHAAFARGLSSDLSSRLRGSATVSLLSVDQRTYDEFSRSSPIPAALYVLEMKPLPGLAVLELHPNFAFVAVDRLLGGMGRGLTRMRDLSEVELALMQPIVERAAEILSAAWSERAEVRASAQRGGSTAQSLHIAAGADPVVVATFEARLFETTIPFRLGMPSSMLEPALCTKPQGSAITATDASGEASSPQHSLGDADVPVVALLGSARVTIGELLELREGDFIRLDTPVDRDLGIRVAGRLRLRGRPGLSGRRLAVVVTEVLGRGDGGDNDG